MYGDGSTAAVVLEARVQPIECGRERCERVEDFTIPSDTQIFVPITSRKVSGEEERNDAAAERSADDRPDDLEEVDQLHGEGTISRSIHRQSARSCSRLNNSLRGFAALRARQLVHR